MDSQDNESCTSELTLRSVDERFNQAPDPIHRRVEEFCALLASQTELESTGKRKTSGLRRDKTPASLSGNRHDREDILC